MVALSQRSFSRKLKLENDNCPLIYYPIPCLCKQMNEEHSNKEYNRYICLERIFIAPFPLFRGSSCWRMGGEEEEEDRGVLETGRTTVTVREGRGAVSETQPLCHRGRAARRWRAIARILFPHGPVVRRRRGEGSFQVVAITGCLLLLLSLPSLASARPGSDATAASGGN